jgi:ATP-dependent DNA helicase RecG
MYLKDIFNNYITEDMQYECKARLNKDDVIGWLKTIDGFANSKGGVLFIGVEDKSYKLIGFESDEIDKEKLYFYHTLKEHFDVLPQITTNAISYVINDKTRYILKIDILESDVKPIIFTYQGLPCIFKRRDGYTSAATSEEIISMSVNNQKVKYDTAITDIKFNFDDFKKLRKFHEKYINSELSEKKLASIGFFNETGYLTKGALLFKDDYDGNDTSVVCSIYQGLTRGDDKILASNRYCGNLIDSLDFMWNFINLHANHGFIKKETYRIDFDAYPKRSIFESLINSIAHRDYFIKGSDICVDLFKNRLVISSPGSIFKNDETLISYKLDKLISNRRNELICNTFVLCNVMEAKGTGFEKILDDYKDADELHKPFIRSKYNQFSITLPDLTYEGGVSIDEEAIKINGIIENPSKYDIKILCYCFNDYKNVKEITSYLNVSNSTFIRKNVLDNLVAQKYLIQVETPREKKYQTNHELVEKI